MATIEFSGAEILRIRNALGLTQEEFAERVGVQRTTVTHWENEIRFPSGAASMLIDQLRTLAAKKAKR